MRPDDHLFPGGIAWLEHGFQEVLGPTPWRHYRWHALRRGGSAACYACHPEMQFFLWWGRWRSVGSSLRYATAFQDAAVVGPLRLPTEPGAGGASRVLAHLEVWAPNMFPAEAEPLPAAAFYPPAWPEDLLDPPPPPAAPKPAGGGAFRASSNRRTPPGNLRPRCSPPGSRGMGGAFVTVDSSGSSGSEGGGGQLLPLVHGSEPLHPAPSSRDAGARGVTCGGSRTHARFSRRDGGPLKWWAVPCVYRRARLARRWRWVL